MDTSTVVNRFSIAGFALAAFSGLGLALAGFAENPDKLPLGALATAPAIFFLGAIPFVLYRTAIKTPSGAVWAGVGTVGATALIHLMTHVALLGADDGMEMLGFLVATVWGAFVVGGVAIAESMSRSRQTS